MKPSKVQCASLDEHICFGVDPLLSTSSHHHGHPQCLETDIAVLPTLFLALAAEAEALAFLIDLVVCLVLIMMLVCVDNKCRYNESNFLLQSEFGIFCIDLRVLVQR